MQPTHRAPEPQLCAAGQTWSWGGRATGALKTQLAGSPEMQHWAEGHRYTYTEPPAIWIAEIQRNTVRTITIFSVMYKQFIWQFWFLYFLKKNVSNSHKNFQCNIHNLLGSHEASTNHYIVSCYWVVCHRLCTCYMLLHRFLHLNGPLVWLCTSLILSYQHNINC